jgi:sulfide:quinone oxidoreductase
MKHLVVLGGGTAGTMVVNKLRPRLPASDWKITLVDESEEHYYQPGFLFIPFGVYTRRDVVKPRAAFVPEGVDLVVGEIDSVDPDASTVTLASGKSLGYDYLVIATGTHPRPDQTPGLESAAYGDTIHDFYTLEGAEALAARLETWEGGRLVVNIVEMPIKCPVAPLEFTFLAEAFFEEMGMRDRVEITYATPLPDAFTKPVAARHLGHMLSDRKIDLETDFYLERVDHEAMALVSYDERELPYDLLVTVPVNMGAEFVARSGLGDELNHVPVDKHTFLTKAHDNVFAIGDAADLPTSKAGSVAHFAVEVFTENFIAHVDGRPMTHEFDGHANCFIESGRGKGMLIDFNYDVEPLPGKYPLPGIGPFSLLKETEMNHWGKLMFKWTYWNVLLRGRPLPLPHEMAMAGKQADAGR